MQMPDELLVHEDAIDAMRTINRVRWVVGDIVGRAVERQEGIPFEWFEVLIALADSPDEALRMGDLATMTLRSKSAMTRLADRIEAAGFIRRDASASDRRVTNVALTEDGRALIERVKPPAARIMIEHFTSHITPEAARLVVDALSKVLLANGVDPQTGRILEARNPATVDAREPERVS
jgi:DNA-binding MarR family transcriptional regulator